MLLYLIRHGETNEAVAGQRQSYNAELSEESIAKLTQEKQEFNGINFSKVYSSPQTRARQTAEVLFDNNIILLDFVHEYIGPKLIETATVEEGVVFWSENFDNILIPEWKHDPESESYLDIRHRCEKLIDFLMKAHINEDIVAVVTHGIFMRHFLGYVLNPVRYSPHIFRDFLFNFTIDNGGYMVLDINIQKRKAKLKRIVNP